MALVVIFFVSVVGLLAFGVYSAVKAGLGRGHRRRVTVPITAAAVNLLRSREVSVDIPAGVAGRDKPMAKAGIVSLPIGWAGQDGDRAALQDMLSERLKTDIALSFDMSGPRPSVSLSIPTQPPARVPWDMAIRRWTDTVQGRPGPVSPYLGDSATGPVHWDLADDSPHAAVPGGGGSGKSELVAWIVAQFMRAGAGVVVLDPKYASHRWLMDRPDVLYAADPETLHEVILWLAGELARRGRESQKQEQEFPQLAVLLEERNSMQDLLRGYWRSIRSSGDAIMSPALTALDLLANQGRSLNINLILAAQATAQADIGKRNNYGAFALAGRLPVNAWRLAGAAKKPAISGKPGRFGWLVSGNVTVFQAAFPDARHEPERLWAWASSGLPRLDTVTLYQLGVVHKTSSVAGTTADPTTTLARYAEGKPVTLGALQARSKRDRATTFPEPLEARGEHGALLYYVHELDEYVEAYWPAAFA